MPSFSSPNPTPVSPIIDFVPPHQEETEAGDKHRRPGDERTLKTTGPPRVSEAPRLLPRH